MGASIAAGPHSTSVSYFSASRCSGCLVFRAPFPGCFRRFSHCYAKRSTLMAFVRMPSGARSPWAAADPCVCPVRAALLSSAALHRWQALACRASHFAAAFDCLFKRSSKAVIGRCLHSSASLPFVLAHVRTNFRKGGMECLSSSFLCCFRAGGRSRRSRSLPRFVHLKRCRLTPRFRT